MENKNSQLSSGRVSDTPKNKVKAINDPSPSKSKQYEQQKMTTSTSSPPSSTTSTTPLPPPSQPNDKKNMGVSTAGSNHESNNIKNENKEKEIRPVEQESPTLPQSPQLTSSTAPTMMEEGETRISENIIITPSTTTDNHHHATPPTTTPAQDVTTTRPNKPSSSNPPGTCPDGGQWGIVKYIGNKTGVLVCLGCFLGGICGLCMLACPQDEKDAYSVNGELYDAAGVYMGLTKKYKFIPTRR